MKLITKNNKTMKESKKVISNKRKISLWYKFFVFLSYLFGILSFKKDTRSLEASKKLINRQNKLNYRKELVFPVINPNIIIKNEMSAYGNNEQKLSFNAQRKIYLSKLNKKKQEDYARDLRKYHQWLFIWPFYFVWNKFLRLFNLDFYLNKNSQYEFSNDQLELINQNSFSKNKFWKHLPFISLFLNYTNYLKSNLQTSKFQKNNWIVFITYSCLLIVAISIIIAYCVFAKEGVAIAPNFNDSLSWPNFFSVKAGLIEATIVLSSLSLVLVLAPILVLLALWLSNINDVMNNLYFVLFQQSFYAFSTIFMLISASMELAIYFAH